MYRKFFNHFKDKKNIANFIAIFSLLVGLGFFVKQIMINFISKDSSFKVYQQKESFEIESPVITFCFNPPLKTSVLKQTQSWDYPLRPIFYTNFQISGSVLNVTDVLNTAVLKLGQDFNLIMTVNEFQDQSPTLLQEGMNYAFDTITQTNSLEIKVRKVITSLFGLCYQVEPLFEMSPNSYLFFKPILSEGLSTEDRPQELKITITSKENSYGMVKNTFMEGDPVSIPIDLAKSSQTLISLKATEYILLHETSNCSQTTHYKCLARWLTQTQTGGPYKFCKKTCVPLVWQTLFEFGSKPEDNLTICQSMEDNTCMFGASLDEVANATKYCPIKCTYRQFDALVDSIITDNSVIMINFASTQITTYEEYLIYDLAGMVGSVGGNFGLFVGWSFHGLFTLLLDFF